MGNQNGQGWAIMRYKKLHAVEMDNELTWRVETKSNLGGVETRSPGGGVY